MKTETDQNEPILRLYDRGHFQLDLRAEI
ncbi:MAG: hypothetical protein JWR38_5486, partial [Mucilaginibacter sp.]|nr:hypothetical protein [Mucilaginibacter sp.]MDN5289211.1 hypothetical protein [Mucilaginibacter sp.]MDN5289212.1 hypothetical protein [Mucilaginibacter sp.]